MTPTAWQVVAASVLLTAWVLVLGAWLWSRAAGRRRLRRLRPDEVGGRPPLLWSRWWSARPRPLHSWLAQPVFSKRLQMMLAFAMASVFSLFLAVAFGGRFVRVFVLLVVVFALYLIRAVVVGFGQLSEAESRWEIELAWGVGGRRSPSADVRVGVLGADDLGLASHLSTHPAEPRPGDHDSSLYAPLDFGSAVDDLGVAEAYEELHALVAELEEVGVVDEPEDATGAQEGSTPVFVAAPEAGTKQASARARRKKRVTARPIYIESSLDDGGEEHTAGGF